MLIEKVIVQIILAEILKQYKTNHMDKLQILFKCESRSIL